MLITDTKINFNRSRLADKENCFFFRGLNRTNYFFCMHQFIEKN